eukprot:Hpha_TRINITY_DN28835_c0_g1::TRINITY_DN28835_c0_g1_i1::g.112463::m.112463
MPSTPSPRGMSEEELSPGSPGWVPHRVAEIDEAEARHRRGMRGSLDGSPTGDGARVRALQQQLNLLSPEEEAKLGRKKAESAPPAPSSPKALTPKRRSLVAVPPRRSSRSENRRPSTPIATPAKPKPRPPPR